MGLVDQGGWHVTQGLVVCNLCVEVVMRGEPSSCRMRLLAFHQRRLIVNLGRYTRRWWVRSNGHLQPACLADHVRAKRLKENLTMKELACQLGIGHMSLKFYEMHKSPPTGRNRGLLIRYLGSDPEASYIDPNASSSCD